MPWLATATPLVRRFAAAQWTVLGVLFAMMGVYSYGLAPGRALLNAAVAVLPAAVVSVAIAGVIQRIALPFDPAHPASRRRGQRLAILRPLALLLMVGYLVSTLWLGWLWLRLVVDTDSALATAFWSRWWSWQLHAAVWPLIAPALVGVAERGAERAAEWRVILAKADHGRLQAELGVLRAHLGPHFLFNTLHSLGGMVHTDPPAAERSLVRLEGLLRYPLRHDPSSPEQRVRLADEWAFAVAYLELEADRFGDRLRVDARLSDEALEREVPPLLIQPLVENAVRHAVAARRHGGTITVEAFCAADGTLQIRVEDDGPGTDLATLDPHRGLGLRSVSQRLGALGPDASLQISSEPGRGFRVLITLTGDRVGAPLA